MTRVAVRFAYLGEGFHGSQIQPGERTVEGEIRGALERVCNGYSNLSIASRTDRGVNALANVAALDTDMDPETLLRALNAVCDGVFFTAYAVVGDDFNPRHASSREYRYVLPAGGLDVERARRCAELFTGEHDFVRFCRPDGKPTVATIDSVDVSESDGCLVLTYRAGFFLWNMVRRTASAIESVASGRSELSDVREALDGKKINFGIGRPDALTLTAVDYDGVDFTVCRSGVLDGRLSEGRFSSSLRQRFYRSLLDL